MSCRSLVRLTRALALALVAHGLHPLVLRAETPLSATGFASTRSTHSIAPFEHVDPFSGNLLLTFTDLVLPGNAGLHLVVQRTYNSKIHPNYEDHNGLKLRTWVGMGWSLHFGRVVQSQSTTPGETVIEMADGSGHALYNALAPPHPAFDPTDPGIPHGNWVTSGVWRYNRTTHTLRMTNGLVYEFGHIGIPNGPEGVVRYVTEIRDPYDNRLTFEYFGAAEGPTDGVKRIVQHLGGGQQREVTFAVTPMAGGYALASMTYTPQGGTARTWTYTHAPAAAPFNTTTIVLGATSSPVPGTTWTFGYRTDPAGPGPELLTVTGPLGGQLSYTYTNVYRPVETETIVMRSIAERRTVSGGMTQGTWTFAYTEGPQQNTTVISTPCGQRETYTYHGIGTLGPGGDYAGWLVGALQRSTTETGSGTVLEERLYGWLPSAVVSDDTMPGLPSGHWASPDVFHAIVSGTQTNRGGQIWKSSHAYHATRYNDVFQPYQIETWDATPPEPPGGRPRRVTTTTFWDQAASSLYRPAVPAGGTVTVGSESLSHSRSFDATTGFVTSTTGAGMTTTYTRTTTGNVASVTDAANKTTNFTYTWGVPDAITPAIAALKTTRTINPDGTVAQEAFGTSTPLTTASTYDALMRPIAVQPPGGTTPTSLAYEPNGADPGGVVYIETGRGTHAVRLYPDRFGRVVRTKTPDGVWTDVAFDACGRVTFESAPYTTANGVRGVLTAYDALGRITSTSTRDDAGAVTSTTSRAYTGIDVTVTDALTRATTYDYDSDSGPGGGQLVALTDAAGQTSTYTYHVSGALASTGGTVAGTRTWVYDSHGRLTSETHPEAETTAFTYTDVNQVASLTNSAGQTLTFTYDDVHRLSGRDGPGTSSDVSIAYDALGRVASESVAGQVTTSYTYDTAGRPATRTDVTGGVGFVSEYTYDPLDRLTALKYPSWHVASYTYGASGRLTGVSFAGQPFASEFDYDDSGRLTSYKTGPVTHTIAFDDRDRARVLTAATTAAGTALELEYAYNAVSLVTGLTDQRAGQSQTFGYDALNRLTSAIGPYGQIAWQYDAAGNRTVESRPGGSLTYAYHATTRRLSSVGGLQVGTFAYDAAGRTTSVTSSAPVAGTTTYGYSPTGLLTAISTSGPVPLTATQVYDASEWRIRHDVTVNGVTRTSFTPRSLGGQVLSEYVRGAQGQTHAWVKDTIYAGGRPLGAYTMPQSPPSVSFTTAGGQATEGLPGAAQIQVAVPGGGVTSTPITVTYATVDAGGGTAAVGTDYMPYANQLVIPAGTPSGTVYAVAFPTLQDTLDEPNETVVLQLTSVTSATVGAIGVFTHTLLDDDPTPTMSITDATVHEDAGTVALTVSLSAASGYGIAAWATAADGTAKATHDYTPTAVVVWFEPGDTVEIVTVPIVVDTFAEPTESFSVALSGLSNVLPGTTTATVTITDDDGPWVDIDPALPGDYFARAWWPGEDSYLQIYNPHSVAVTVRITYIRANGAGVRREHWLGVGQRLGLHVPSDPFVSGQSVQGSAVVQSLDGAHPVVAEVVGYAGAGWQAGDASEGVMPALSWTFAEGATGLSVGFEEWLTVFNPSSQPVTATLTYYGASGQLGQQSVSVPSGPGLYTVYVNNHWTTSEHSTVVAAVGRDSGQPVPIVAERRMRWNSAIEGHSSAGQSAPSGIWEFPEGGRGLFSTFIALFNPHTAAATVRLYYRHENGSVYYQDMGVPAQSRITVGSPGFLPAGAYATEVYGLTHAVYAERVVYAGTGWTIGHASPGSATAATTWRFAEGSSQSFFDTYFIVINQSGTSATVTLTYRNVAGAVIGSDVLTLPGYLRGAVWANGTVGGQDFTTEVSATQAIVAERVMYWPTGSSLLGGGGGTLDATAETSSLGESPPVIEDSGGGAPSPYTLTAGVQGPTQQLTDTPEALVIGKPTPNSTQRDGLDGGMQSQSGGLPWYGSHLSVGKKP